MTKSQQLEIYRQNMKALDESRARQAEHDEIQRWHRVGERVSFWVAMLALAFAVWLSTCGAGERTPRWLRVEATAYCPCAICTDGDGITATGRDASKRGVAVDPQVIGLGARLDVPGVGVWLPADDVGGLIKGERVDIRMADHATAKAWGRRVVVVRVWE